MPYGEREGSTLETRSGPVRLGWATRRDLPSLDAILAESPRGAPPNRLGWDGDIERNEVTTLADPDGSVWGFLDVSADMDLDVTLRWLALRSRVHLVAPTLVAVAIELASRGHGPVNLFVGEGTALLSDLLAAGFDVDGERTRGGRVGLTTTRMRLANAAAPRGRVSALAEATDDELAAEVRRRGTMAAVVYMVADIREELRLGEYGMDDAALDGAARALFDMTRAGLANAMERAALSYVHRRWDEAGIHLSGKVGDRSPTP